MARRKRPFDDDQGVFMISVAAELAGMHPQTLRIYESKGLIKPKRSPKKTRLYSQRDVERLRRIQELTTGFGLNLAGVERVLALEEVMDTMQAELERMREESERLEREMRERIQQIHRSYKHELVRWQPPGELVRSQDLSHTIKVHVQRQPRNPGAPAAGLPADGSRSRRRKPEA
jgi:MerR family transcriptional regulator, heat shock protein HspR